MLTKWREGNRARWVGIRPGHGGAQIAKYGQAHNEIILIHTVAAGKVFYLTHWTHWIYENLAGQNGLLYVQNAADVLVYVISDLSMGTLGGLTNSGSLFYPLEIPEGYDVCVRSMSDTVVTEAFIHGWEE